MGILSNLFKPKSAASKFEERDPRQSSGVPPSPDQAKEEAESNSAPASTKNPPNESGQKSAPRHAGSGASLKTISFGGSKTVSSPREEPETSAPKKNITHTRAQEPPKTTKRPFAGGPATIPDRRIHIALEEFASQIPAGLLNEETPPDGKLDLKVSALELLPLLAKGKAALPLARIIELLPGAFGDQPLNENVEIKLPLQKVVLQFSAFPGGRGQMEELFPALDPQFANLVIEQGAAPVVIMEPAKPPEPTQPAAEKTEPVPDQEPAASIPPEIEAVTAATVPADPPAPPQPAMEEEKIAESVLEMLAEQTPEPEPQLEPEEVSYSLAALLPNLPKSWLGEDLKDVDDSTRVTVPFHLIEPQLSKGRVELAFDDFVRGLPENFKTQFSAASEEAKAAKILVPLNEVFLNLPGVEALPTPAPKPIARKEEPEPEPGAETSEPPSQAVIPEPAAEIAVPVEETQAESVAAGVPQPEAKNTGGKAPEPENKTEPLAQAETPVESPVTVSEEQEAKPVAQIPEFEAKPETAPPESAPQSSPEPQQKEVEAKEPETGASSQSDTQPAAVLETPKPEAEAPQAPAQVFVESPAIPEQPSVSLAPPKIQLQQLTPPSVTAQATPPLPVTPPASSVEPGKILAFTGTPSAFNPVALKDLLTVDGKFDPAQTVTYISELPGITAAILTIENETKTAGFIPGSFNAEDIGRAAAILLQSLESQQGQFSPGLSRNITMHHDGFSSTYIKYADVISGILHPERSLAEGLHEKLTLVLEEIVRLRSI